MIIRNIRKVVFIIFTITAFLSCSVASFADDTLPLTNTEARIAAAGITARNTPWKMVETSGKLKMSVLPLSPSVKIWMKRGESVVLSVRAPFIGEAARIEFDRDSITMVNKTRKVYCRETTASALKSWPAAINELQNILMGRMAVFGYGDFTNELVDNFSIYPQDDEMMLAVASDTIQPREFKYGYLLGGDGSPITLMLSTSLVDAEATVSYSYDKGIDIDFDITSGDRSYQAGLELDRYKEISDMPEKWEPGSKFHRVGIKEFIKSF